MIAGDVIAGVKPFFEQRLEKEGFVLVDMRCYRNQRGEFVFEVLADRAEGGIALDECARLNQELGRVLDERHGLGAPYILEVSSPGVDRPLRTASDFRRNLGRRARFFLKGPSEGRSEYCGTVEGVEGSVVSINEQGRSIRIPLEKINKAKQVIP